MAEEKITDEMIQMVNFGSIHYLLSRPDNIVMAEHKAFRNTLSTVLWNANPLIILSLNIQEKTFN